MRNILIIGSDPDFLDFSSPAFASMPGINADVIRAGLNGSAQQLIDAGHDAEICWIDLGETAQGKVRETLQKKNYDVVTIGAGIRVPEANFNLFEELVNTIHAYAPTAKFAFNKNPQDTADATLRQINKI